MSIQARLANTGAITLNLIQEGSGVAISVPERDATGTDSPQVRWKRFAVVSIVERHTYLEPSETIEDSALIRVPADVPVHVQLRMISSAKGRFMRRPKLEWNTTAIIEPPDPDTNIRKSASSQS